MNLADAIRQAAGHSFESNEISFDEASKGSFPREIVNHGSTPEPTQVSSGTPVRLELFLSPEQLSNLFRAVSATQHSMLTLRETASYLRVSATRLQKMANDGEIPGFNIDGRWRFPRNGIEEWLTMQSFQKESA